MTRRLIALLSLTILLLSSVPCADAEEVQVFASGEQGYDTFRIPAIIKANDGTLVAFCEGRKSGRGDSGNIDVVSKRSSDNGRTWSELRVLWDDGENTCGNPCPVLDDSTGRILLPLTWNHGSDHEQEIKNNTAKDTRRVFLMTSDDHGNSWTNPIEITSQAKHPAWTWYATGPGNGIQLAGEKDRGRLVIPCDHNILIDGESVRRSHCLLSDDGGETWRMSEPLERDTNECAVVELADGRLLLNMRSYHGKNLRAIAYSADGGETWSGVTLDPELIEPICQASLIRHSDGPLVFANPASTKREKMTVRSSSDEGKSWPDTRLIHAGSAAYSALVSLDDSEIGLLYEKENYGQIVFVRIALASLSK